MNYCRIIGLGLSLALALSAAAESRLQLKAHELEMSGDYLGAIELYKNDMARQGNSAAALEGVARCYFAQGDFAQAETFYAQLVAKDSSGGNHIAYARVLLHNGKYAEAAQAAQKAAGDTAAARHVPSLLALCDSAVRWEENPAPYRIHNLENVNTCYSDWGAQLYNPQKLIFISDRPMEEPNCDNGRARGASISGGFTAEGVENDTLVLMEWSAARMMPYPFTDKGKQVGPIAVMPSDSITLYYTRSGKSGVVKRRKVGKEVIREVSDNLEIYSSRRTDYGWEYVTPFEFNDAKRYSVMHPYLSADGSTLYFASDMPGGQGGFDIWMCEMQASGAWGKPANLGTPVNTPGNETFPTVAADGTLYFSSNRHVGMGGLDIFYTKKGKGKWQPVRNMRAPFNSSADDFFFVAAGDSVGYFSSNRAGGKGGDDIYMYTQLSLKSKTVAPPPAPVDTTPEVEADTTPIAVDTTPAVEVDTTSVVIVDTLVDTVVVVVDTDTVVVDTPPKVREQIMLAGKLLDQQTKQPLTNVKICATLDGTKTSECRECLNDGSFSFELKNNERYTISAFKEGYQSTAPIRLLATTTLEEEEMPIEMTPKAKAEFQSAEAVIDRTAAPKKRLLPREYRVQVLANWQETDWAYFDRLRHAYPQFELQYTKRDRAVRFTYGSFVNQQEARRYLRLFMNLGYYDSFIAVFEYGKQVESIFSGGSSERVAPRRRPAPRR